MRCTGTMPCPGSTSGRKEYSSSSPCTYNRKLCVTCSVKSGTTMIRVQTNNLPNHCSDSNVNTPYEFELDWEVAFNPDVSGKMNYSESDTSTTEKESELLCDLQRTSYTNMLDVSKYALNSYVSKAPDDVMNSSPSGGKGLRDL